MIKTVVGNLLDAEENVIVHQVNCQGKMASGIAKQIREKHPNVYEQYMKLFNENTPDKLIGKTQAVSINNGRYVINLFSQLNYGYDGKRYTSYDAIFDGLKHIKTVAVENNLSIAIPYKLGSDRGGADWDVVYKMIEKIFGNYDVTIYKLEEK